MRIFLLISIICLLFQGCNWFSTEKQVQYNDNGDTIQTDSTLKNYSPEKNKVKAPRITKKISDEEYVYAMIEKLPEVNKLAKEIDSLSKGKRKLGAILNNKPTPDDPLWGIKLGEDNGENFVTYIHFYVNKETREVFIYDVGEDRLLTLSEWRKLKN